MVLFISKKINKKITYFPSSVTLVQKKCKKIYKIKIHLWYIISICYFQREILTWMFIEQMSHF